MVDLLRQGDELELNLNNVFTCRPLLKYCGSCNYPHNITCAFCCDIHMLSNVMREDANDNFVVIELKVLSLKEQKMKMILFWYRTKSFDF